MNVDKEATMTGFIFALAYIGLVYLMLGFFKVAKNGSYEGCRTSVRQVELIKNDIINNSKYKEKK